MQLQNSYIFIPKPYKRKETPKRKDGMRIIEVDYSFNYYFESAFPTAVSVPDRRNFYTSEYTYTVELDGSSIEALFLIHEVVEKYYLNVIVTGKSKIHIIKGLEYVQEAILKSSISQKYNEIIAYDAISEYYCNKIYPKLNELERNLRKLLYNIYIVNLGRDYYQTTISSDLQNKIKSVIQAKGNEEKKETERMQKFFYSMEFADIYQMLFEPHWTEIDEKAKDDFLKSHLNLSLLTDDQLRQAFSKITPKSDWKRFFADKMESDVIKSLINEIRRSRNNIAHCKFFYRAEYVNCNKAMSKFNEIVKSAIAITADKDFSEKNSEMTRNTLASFAKRLKEIKVFTAEALLPMIQLSHQYSEMLDPIRDNMTQFLLSFQKAIQPLIDSESRHLTNLSNELDYHSQEENYIKDEEDDEHLSDEGEDDARS